MRPVTDAFLEAVKHDHTILTRADVLHDGEIIDTITTITGGSVTLDAGAQTRGHCDITLVDEDGTLTPSSASHMLAPYGNELHIHSGLYLPNGKPEVVSLGIFRIDDPDADGSGVVKLTGLDRSARIADAKFEAPYQVAAGTLVTTAIRDVLEARYPDIQMRFVTTTKTTPSLLAEEGSDPWDFCVNMALSIGMRLYFDGDGVCALEPDVTGGDFVVELVEGKNGVLVAAARKWSRAGAFNRWIVTGENTGSTPVRAVATDDNPLSPTYYYGPFGQTPKFVSSSFLADVDQAEDYAAALKARGLGTTQTVSFGTLVNPALEPGDIARIARSQIGLDESHIIDALTIPLGVEGVMSGSTRASQVIT